MEKKDFSPSQPPAPSEPEGIFVDDERITKRDSSADSSNDAPIGKKAPAEEIEIDKSAFEEGDPAEMIGFAPQDDLPLPDREDADPALAFDSLSGKPIEEENGAKIIRKKIVRREKGGLVKGLSAVLVYLLLIVVAGVVSGLAIISVANDVFAFTKDDSVYELTIENTDMSLRELSEFLHEEGIIRYPSIFRLYVGLTVDEDFELHEGTFSISPSYNYDKILACLDPAPVREEITITFSEGMTVDDVIDTFVKNGIGTRAGFVEVIENYEFDYWFLEDLETTEDRFYRLEGYLFPDTYRFYSDSTDTTTPNATEIAALTKMLNNFEKKVPDTYRTRCEELGITLDEAVILASMIESECARINDLEYVSAVFHNRLKSASFDGLLGSDATIQYLLRHTTGERKPELTAEDLAIDSPYNTRLNKGLPPGAICNPSLNALMAAIYPNTTCGYYYFVAQSNGYNLYAKTLAEHNKNVAAVRNGA